jgi:hypothetical protein
MLSNSERERLGEMFEEILQKVIAEHPDLLPQIEDGNDGDTQVAAIAKLFQLADEKAEDE